MSITLTQVITTDEYLEVFPQDEAVEETAIQSAINRAVISLDGICGGMIAKVWPISKPDDPAYDPTSEMFRNTTEIGYIKQAVAIQTQYNVSRNLDFTSGSENYSSGSNNYNETRSRPELVADETIYQLLAQARVYNPNITTDTTIANNGNLSGFYNPSYDPLENYVTYNVGDLRYVFKHNSLGANKYLKYDENGNITIDEVKVSNTGTSSAIANFITINGQEWQIGGSGGSGPSQYLQTASVSGNTLTLTEINGSSPTPITYTPTGLVEIPGEEAISHLPYNFAYHFAMTPTSNSINGTIYTLTLDNNKTVKTWPISIPGATSSSAGVMTANDKQTLSTRAEDFSVDGTTIKWKSGATRTLESGIPSAVHFKGVVASTTDLPASPSEGDLYYVGTTTPYNIYIYNGSGWIAAGTSSVDLSKIVTTDTDQEINGSKTFQGTTKIDKHATFTIDNDATSVSFGTVGIKAIVDALFPIGAVWTTTDSTQDPNTLFSGTTWTLISTAQWIWDGTNGEIPVFGNGTSLGVTDGVKKLGLFGYALSGSSHIWGKESYYAKNIGSYVADSGSGFTTNYPIGIVRKSDLTSTTYGNTGLVADLSATATQVYMWKRTA